MCIFQNDHDLVSWFYNLKQFNVLVVFFDSLLLAIVADVHNYLLLVDFLYFMISRSRERSILSFEVEC